MRDERDQLIEKISSHVNHHLALEEYERCSCTWVYHRELKATPLTQWCNHFAYEMVEEISALQ